MTTQDRETMMRELCETKDLKVNGKPINLKPFATLPVDSQVKNIMWALEEPDPADDDADLNLPFGN
jgi:hypothetical protein